MLITVVNLKGGVAKTTTAAYLGVALTTHGSVLLVDADPQHTLLDWAQEAGPPFPRTVEAVGARLTPQQAHGADFVVVDTPPGDPLASGRAVDAAEFVLIPSRATHVDAKRTLALADLLAKQGAVATVLLTQVEGGTRVLTEVRQMLAESLPAGIDIYELDVPKRQHFTTAHGGVPRPTDLYPYDRIAQELQEAR